MVILLNKCQNCSKHNVDYVTNKFHEWQTIRISLSVHLPVPLHVCDYKHYSVRLSETRQSEVTAKASKTLFGPIKPTNPSV